MQLADAAALTGASCCCTSVAPMLQRTQKMKSDSMTWGSASRGLSVRRRASRRAQS